MMTAAGRLQCHCGNTLALAAADGLWHIRHHGRQLVVQHIVSITCEDCKGTLQVAPPLPPFEERTGRSWP